MEIESFPHPLTVAFTLFPFLLPLSCLVRMTLMFFAVSGLDILNSLDSLSPKLKEEIVEWIYSQQITPNAEGWLRVVTC